MSPLAAVLTVVVATLVTERQGLLEDYHQPEDIRRIRRSIRRQKAEVVVVGNSLVGRGVHGATLQRALGVPVYRLWRNSMRSAWWYLALKNVIAHTDAKTVVICFRNTVLTDPQRAVRGEYKEGVGQLATEHEPLLHRLAYYAHLDDLQLLLTRHWGLFQRRDAVQRKTERKIKKHVARRLFDDDYDEDEMNEAIERVLADENMAADLITRAQAVWEEPTDPAAYDFRRRVADSFLPPILRTAREHGIQLVFVRMKTRRDAARQAGRVPSMGPHPHPELLARYVQDLRAYLADRGVPLLDFADSPHIKSHHFREHDHLTREGRRLFSRLLAEQLRPHLAEAESHPRPPRSSDVASAGENHSTD